MSAHPLEEIYHSHHGERRGDGFVLLGDERGGFLASRIGTGNKVLDIGCRDGALTKYFAAGNDVLGVDIDSAALARAKESLSIDVRQMDLNGEWDLPADAFDVVVAAEVIEHLYYPEKVLEKISAVLRSGGVLLGTVPNAFSLAHRFRYLQKQKHNTPLMDPTHINHFTVAELTALLERRFEVVEVHGLGRLGALAARMPQAFAYDLAFSATKPAH